MGGHQLELGAPTSSASTAAMAFAPAQLLEKFRKEQQTHHPQPSPGLPKLVDGRGLHGLAEYLATSPSAP